MAFTLFKYGRVSIFGDALTLFSTVPLMPTEAQASAYCCRRCMSGSEPSAIQKMLCPA